ncbi:MAG TPA: hypothetical protein VG840_01310, partial [Casimicrobiaceae bacterium]|nr:hypothetical protein [Casimicrobiaceae bacterium]
MRLPTLLLQLLLAAIVGYAAARYAVPVPETGTQRTPPAVPAPHSPAAPPPALPVSPPATPANTTGTALSVSFRSAVARAAPSVFTVHSARTVS